MKSIAQVMAAVGLSLTEFEEEYILTPEEEQAALQYQLDYFKQGAKWKMDNKRTPDNIVQSHLNELSIDGFFDAEEKKKILKLANTAKHRDIEEKARVEKERQEREEKQRMITLYWCAKRFYQCMKVETERQKKTWQFDDDNKHYITALCYFMSNDPRFETELGYDFDKGLLVRGPVGTGKTHPIKCIADNDLKPIVIVSMLDIVKKVRDNTEVVATLPADKLLYLDDVGTEEAEAKSYGNKINWFKEFIETLYLNSTEYNRLIISTNLNGEGIERHYGIRARSRVREMFNIIDVNGKDRRK